ncbi:MAG: diguanylate cyclase [Deltaproteobacteria bacterium]|nr:diguanylate cyclase [Deltaproteobacteria bacterium]
MSEDHSTARVLVVEDSRAQREHLAEVLTKRGFSVTTASGGLEALKQIRAAPPDVVLLDVVLDDIDGYSVCRWVRLGERTRDVIVIMLTVKREVRERVEGLNVGADDYLPKPVDDEELEARIFAAMRTRQVRNELRVRNTELEGLLARSEHAAMTDAVTGIYNRRRYVDMLTREWATARRYGHNLSCALIDVDHFKRINDIAGHAAGDEALRAVAGILAGAVREVDLCARYGGDEFAVMFPHTPREKAVVAVERALTRLRRDRAQWASHLLALDFSAGVASSEDASIGSPEQLLEAADRALYSAKRERGRIIVAHDGILGN